MQPPPAGSKRSFALALGGGAARGLAHIVVLEAIDELGLKPAAIAGTSIGALLGAAYASGISGRELRRHVIAAAHDRAETWRRLMAARAVPIAKLFSAGLGNPMLIDAEKFCRQFLPEAVPDTFEALRIPLTVVATDLHGREERAFAAGPLRPAIAASLAVPGLIRPVEQEGRVYVDGAATNPLPFDHLRGAADVIVAVDVSGGADPERRSVPDPWNCLFSTLQVMGHTIIAEKLRRDAPDIVIRPRVEIFRMLDFFQASAILRTAEPAKAELKRALAERLAIPAGADGP